MVPFLFLLFIVVPILEIAVMIKVGAVLGVFPTIALMVVTAALGASLVRSQGIHTLLNIRDRLHQGELPDRHIAEGILLAIAGVLLVTPGFLTDFLGLLFLTPVSRAWIANYMINNIKVSMVHRGTAQQHDTFEQHRSQHTSEQQGKTIDGEFTRKD